MTTVLEGDCRRVLGEIERESIDCVVTSPPYWGLRNYGTSDQIGREDTPDAYVANLLDVMRLVREALRPAGTLWLNLGDSYAGSPGGFQGKNGERFSRTFTARIDMRKGGPGLKPKDLVGIPWKVAFALQADGWWLRSDIVWHKPNAMPESVKDRPTRAHEFLFLLAKSEVYFYDADAIKEPSTYNRGGARERVTEGRGRDDVGYGRAFEWCGDTRNKRDVWSIATRPVGEDHFAAFPEDLVVPCIMAGCPRGGTVLDPFAGTGTVGRVAEALGRRSILIESNPEYVAIARRRTAQQGLAFGSPEQKEEAS